MATPPVVPPVTTPQDQQIIQQATTGTSTPPTEFSYTMADGQTYKGATPQEVMEAVGKRYDQLYGHKQKLETENAQYRQVVQSLPGQTATQAGGFDQQKYWDLLVNNPIEAQSYLFQHTPEYQDVRQNIEAQQWQTNAAQFRTSNPDFAVNDENITKLNTLCQKLYPNASVLSAEQMSAAHAMAVRNKLYEVQTVTPTPPPPPPNSGITQDNTAPDVNKMDQQQLREYIEAETAKANQK